MIDRGTAPTPNGCEVPSKRPIRAIDAQAAGAFAANARKRVQP